MTTKCNPAGVRPGDYNSSLYPTQRVGCPTPLLYCMQAAGAVCPWWLTEGRTPRY